MIVLRLKHECALSNAQIAAALGVAKGSVANYLAAAAAAELMHTEALTLDDAALNARLHPQRYVYAQFAVPDFGAIRRELRRKGGHAAIAVGGVAGAKPKAFPTAARASASATSSFGNSCAARCGRSMSLAISCSSITPARGTADRPGERR